MRLKNNLSRRLSTYVIGISGLIFLSALFALYLVGRKAATQQANSDINNILDILELRLDYTIQDTEKMLTETSWYLLQCDTKEQASTIIKHKLSMRPSVKNLTLGIDTTYARKRNIYTMLSADNQDSIVIRSSKEIDYLNEEWFDVPMKAGKPIWCKIQPNNDLIVRFAVPIQNSDNRFLGVGKIDISTEWIDEIITKVKPYPNAQLIVHTANGFLFYSTIDEKESNYAKLSNDNMVFTRKSSQKNWTIELICPKDEIFDQLHRLNIIIAAIIIVGLIMLYFIMNYVINRVISPLKKFDTAAHSIAQGDFDVRLPKLKHRDELFTLAESFNFMQHSLKDYIEQLKNTTASKERIENELLIAANIQKSILNNHFPTDVAYSIYATLKPAREVGGDLYDVVQIDDKIWFIIGDVSGKGVAASMYMSVVIFTFRTMVKQGIELTQIVKTLNETISYDNKSLMFVTIIAGVINTVTNEIELCNAGHNPPFLKTPQGTSMINIESNIALGVVDDYNFSSCRYPFQSGSSLVLYTDGITESMNKENQLFSDVRLKEVILRSENYMPELLVENILSDVNSHSNGADQSDDITLLIITNSQIVINLEPKLQSISQIKGFIQNIGAENTNSLRLAVEEIVVNAISYSQTQSPIQLSAIQIGENVIVNIKYSGQPFNPLEVPRADISSDIEDRMIGGLGIFLAKNMTDNMTYHWIDDHNIISLTVLLDRNNL